MNDSDVRSIHTGDFFDLTQSQSLIWAGQQLRPDSPMYNMAFAFEIHGSIDESIFQQAFQKLIGTSDAMRIVFEMVKGQPQQKIRDELPYELTILDFSTNENKKQQLGNWVKEASQKKINLTERLFDAALIKMNSNHYVWFLNQHHLITDGWSKTVQFKSMNAFYTALINSNDQKEGVIPAFTEFINFEANQRSNQLSACTEYWQHKLNTLAASNELFKKTASTQDTLSERISLKLSLEKTTSIRQLTLEPDLRAWTADLSLFNIFSMLLMALLYQKSGQQNLIVGIPVANRPSKDFKNTPGLFTELFPLAVGLKSDETFSSLFEKVRNESFECLKNAGPGRSTLEMSKRFNVVMNYMNGTFGDFNGSQVNSKWIFTDHIDPGHALRFQVFDFDKSAQIEICFDLNYSVFNTAQQEALLQDFSILLDRFIEDRNQAINIMSKGETELLQGLNKKQVGFSQKATITKLFEAQAVKNPDHIALVFGDQKITYATLDKKANQLANYLKEQGVKEEYIVGLCLDRSPEMIIGILAVIKAGGVYMPIDSDYPQDRVDYMVSDSGAQLIISHTKHQVLFSETEANLVVIDQDWVNISKAETSAPKINLKANNAIYIIYTSGSTGKPKGVVIEHRNVVRLFFNEQPLFDFHAQDVWTLFHSYCFDFSVWEMYGALLFGGTLVIVPKDTTCDPEAYVELLKKENVTILNQTPGAFFNYQDLYCDRLEKSPVRYIVFGGEALMPSLLARWEKSYPKSKLINMYGITETTVHVTYKEITTAEISSGISNIGTAIPTLECLILDEQLKLIPFGLTGEIYVGGAGLARGYLNRPQLTKARFIDHPSGGRLYKTGDLGMRLADGSIQYKGRLDDQVKIRGHRIELGEIETTLNQLEGLAQCVVVAKTDKQNNNKLIAYVKVDEGVTESAIKSYLRKRLPKYMVPAIVVKVPSFLLTANGKIDKTALPPVEAIHENVTANLTEPSTEFEQIIQEIWSDILSISRIGIHQDFFDLGGDSLSGIRVIAHINETFELVLKVNLIFEESTIAALAIYVEQTIQTIILEMDAEKSNKG